MVEVSVGLNLKGSGEDVFGWIVVVGKYVGVVSRLSTSVLLNMSMVISSLLSLRSSSSSFLLAPSMKDF